MHGVTEENQQKHRHCKPLVCKLIIYGLCKQYTTFHSQLKVKTKGLYTDGWNYQNLDQRRQCLMVYLALGSGSAF